MVIFVEAIAGQRLVATLRAALNVTAGYVVLSLHDPAIVAFLNIGAPIILLASIANARVELLGDFVVDAELGLPDLLLPFLVPTHL